MAGSSAQALAAFLAARANITAIVGQRIYRAGGVAFNEVRSKVVYTSISQVPYSSLDQESSGITRERFQIDCWGDGSTPGRVSIELANVLKARYADGGIDGFKGTISYTDDTPATQTLTVLEMKIVDSSDLLVSPWDGDQKGADGVSIDVSMTYRE